MNLIEQLILESQDSKKDKPKRNKVSCKKKVSESSKRNLSIETVCNNAVQAIQKDYPYDVTYKIKDGKIIFTVEYRLNYNEPDHVAFKDTYSINTDRLDIFGDNEQEAGIYLADAICEDLGLVSKIESVSRKKVKESFVSNNIEDMLDYVKWQMDEAEGNINRSVEGWYDKASEEEKHRIEKRIRDIYDKAIKLNKEFDKIYERYQ